MLIFRESDTVLAVGIMVEVPNVAVRMLAQRAMQIAPLERRMSDSSM